MELIPAASAYGIGVLVWSPLHGGLLGGALRRLEEGTAVKTAQGRAMVALEKHRDTIVEYEKYCQETGLDPAEVAMSWTLRRPGVTSVVIGSRTLAHLDGARRALDLELPDEVRYRLDEMFPPVGPGPEAWAW